MTKRLVQTNFMADWVEKMRQIRAANGFAVPQGTSDDDVELFFFKVNVRLIKRAPRTVKRVHGFACPAQRHLGFDALVQKIERGDDLTPHQSTLLKDLDYDDALLNDWGIHHLHLGTTPHPKDPMRPGPLDVFVGPQIETAGLDDAQVQKMAERFQRFTSDYVERGLCARTGGGTSNMTSCALPPPSSARHATCSRCMPPACSTPPLTVTAQ